jgi:hypothetical protein
MDETDPKPREAVAREAVTSEAVDGEAADPEWFREPTRREHWIGAALFSGFGLFFLLFFFVERGSGFRWIILGLAVISLGRGLRHAVKALRRRS